ncbi:hypothetical protein B5X24_HaOG216567 [Helicoverpa armigera]|nr:hypothetical protein B5X24_HaOG216567 [Helicoverpa armigera]
MCRFSVFLCLVAIPVICNLVGADAGVDEYTVYSFDIMDMPNDCYGKNYCFTKGDSYPQKDIDTLLENIPQALERLLKDRQSSYIQEDDDVNCPANTIFKDKPIYYVRDKSGEVRAVVQSDNKFLQSYSTKECLYEGRITNKSPHLNNTSFVRGAVLNKFNITCETKFLDFDFFVLNTEYPEPRMEVVTTAIPIACRCQMNELNTKFYKR